MLKHEIALCRAVTIDQGAAAVTTAQGFGQSEKGAVEEKPMAFESIFRKASVALVAGVYV